MNRDDLKIPEPCDADWDAMTGDDRKRFCSACTKHVHNLSEMNRDEAKSLLDTHDNLCVQYASHVDGEVFFRDSTHPSWRLHRQVEGAKRLLAAALLIPLAAACDAPDQTPNAVSPVILINSDGTIKTPDPGAGLAPTMIATPVEENPDEFGQMIGKVAIEEKQEEPEQVEQRKGERANEEIEMLQGDVAYEPEEEHLENTSDKEEEACDPGKDTQTTPPHDTSEDTGKVPELDPPRIDRGQMIAPATIRKTRGKRIKP